MKPFPAPDYRQYTRPKCEGNIGFRAAYVAQDPKLEWVKSFDLRLIGKDTFTSNAGRDAVAALWGVAHMEKVLWTTGGGRGVQINWSTFILFASMGRY
jgi:hypothetical protein